jgi:3-deoxy-7-phosphoheptulonate synthase
VQNALLLVMRVYFEKPRTRLGWKGLIYDPDLDGRGNIRRGLKLARHLLLECTRLGVPTASEILDLVTPQFYAELLAWGAIGARTVESPLHRQMASALSAPVGFKNPTSGNLSVAIDALVAASKPHTFPSISIDGQAVTLTTTGNPHCHLILRGSTDGPNYDASSVKGATALLAQQGLPRRLMIDCSHGNSDKNPQRQLLAVESIASQIESGSDEILGTMLESHLVEGRQDLSADPRGLCYGQSITDSCLGWSQTSQALERLARAARSRFSRR